MIWADRRFRLGHGRAFALYVAAYCFGRLWIELLRTDPANTFFGIRINVYTSVLVFLGAIIFLIVRRNVGREDPAVVWGPDRKGKSTVAAPDAESADVDAPDSADAAAGDGADPDEPADADARRPSAT